MLCCKNKTKYYKMPVEKFKLQKMFNKMNWLLNIFKLVKISFLKKAKETSANKIFMNLTQTQNSVSNNKAKTRNQQQNEDDCNHQAVELISLIMWVLKICAKKKQGILVDTLKPRILRINSPLRK